MSAPAGEINEGTLERVLEAMRLLELKAVELRKLGVVDDRVEVDPALELAGDSVLPLLNGAALTVTVSLLDDCFVDARSLVTRDIELRCCVVEISLLIDDCTVDVPLFADARCVVEGCTVSGVVLLLDRSCEPRVIKKVFVLDFDFTVDVLLFDVVSPELEDCVLIFVL